MKPEAREPVDTVPTSQLSKAQTQWKRVGWIRRDAQKVQGGELYTSRSDACDLEGLWSSTQRDDISAQRFPVAVPYDVSTPERFARTWAILGCAQPTEVLLN